MAISGPGTSRSRWGANFCHRMMMAIVRIPRKAARRWLLSREEATSMAATAAACVSTASIALPDRNGCSAARLRACASSRAALGAVEVDVARLFDSGGELVANRLQTGRDLLLTGGKHFEAGFDDHFQRRRIGGDVVVRNQLGDLAAEDHLIVVQVGHRVERLGAERPLGVARQAGDADPLGDGGGDRGEILEAAAARLVVDHHVELAGENQHADARRACR